MPKPKYPKYVKVKVQWQRRQAGWKMLFKETGDIRYAALAIGRAISIGTTYKKTVSPPQWALSACEKWFETYDKSYFDPLSKGKKGPPGYKDDDNLLDEMAKLTLSGTSVNAAAKKVFGKDPDKSNVDRLSRKWRDELGDHPDKNTDDLFHPREQRFLRLKGKFRYHFQS